MCRTLCPAPHGHGRIHTSVPKAKEARPIAERMITLARRGGLSNLRLAGQTIRSKDVLHKVFNEYKARYATRPGGYTRIVKFGPRRGDNAPISIIAFVGELKADKKEAATPES